MKYKIINKREKDLSLLLQVLKNRGIEDVEHYLHVNDNDILNPLLLENMGEGVKMFLKNAELQVDTFLLVDADTDGMTSSAIIYNYARRLWPDWVDNHWKYFLHSGKKHGLSDCIDLALKRKFVVIPDAGSNDHEEIKILKDNGIDVLILDHHNADKLDENAIVINSQFSYPNHTLSGAGVVYKFCQQLDQELNIVLADDFLDLAAVGLVADMMDIRDYETHRIIQKGLNNIKNPMINAIIEKNAYSLQGHLNPKGVAWNISPLINAVTRIGSVDENIMFFESFLENKANQLIPSGKRGHKGEMVPMVDEAVRIASNVRSRQNKMRDNRFKEVCAYIDEYNLCQNKIIVVCQANVDDDEKGITGLIANQAQAKYKHPVLLLSYGEKDGVGYWSGSGRNVANSELEDLREFISNSDLAEFAQGHESAFGVSFKDENIDKFLQYSNKALENLDFNASIYYVDDIFNSITLNEEDIITVYRQKDLWGQEMSEPLVAVEKIKINADSVFINEKVLKIQGPNNISFIKFKPTAEELMFFSAMKDSYNISLVGTCEYSAYDSTAQIMMKDYSLEKNTLWDF